MNVAKELATFLRDYGGFGTAALSLMAVVVLYRARVREAREKYELALQIAPLAERLLVLLERGAKARRRRTMPTPPQRPTRMPAFGEDDEGATPPDGHRLP